MVERGARGWLVVASIGIASIAACGSSSDDDAGTGTGGGPAATGGTSGGGSSATGGAGACDAGPLSAPIAGCQPAVVPDTGDFYADCVARINQLRWDCQCLPPLARWTEAEACADQQAEYDFNADSYHAGFTDGICSPGGSAQSECPGSRSLARVLESCLQGMWDEGPGEPYSEHGHYINMTNSEYSRVGCGQYVTPSGEVWAVMNFD